MTRTHLLNGNAYTIKELAEISGVKEATIRDRLRRGYPVEQAVKIVATNESVEQFCEASWWEDWIGMPINDLYKIYWSWSVSREYTPLHIKGFSRQLFQLHPNLKIVPSRINDKYLRIIREK